MLVAGSKMVVGGGEFDKLSNGVPVQLIALGPDELYSPRASITAPVAGYVGYPVALVKMPLMILQRSGLLPEVQKALASIQAVEAAVVVDDL
jgi:hypothetical protein